MVVILRSLQIATDLVAEALTNPENVYIRDLETDTTVIIPAIQPACTSW